MNQATSDLCDQHGEHARVLEPMMHSYGGKTSFSGIVSTVKAFEDYMLVRERLAQLGNGRVLVVDGGASIRYALMGDQTGELAVKNGWAGVVINGAVRDVEALAQLEIGILALAACPRRSPTGSVGQSDVPVTFAGVTFQPGEWLVADMDGVIVMDSGVAREANI